MTLKVDEIMQLMAKFKELGLTSFEIESEGIKMGNVPLEKPQAETLKAKSQPIPEDIQATDIVTPMGVFDELDDDEVLYWSTPYFDEMQANKEKMRSAKATEMPNPKRTQE